ncbi:hypothetical protein HYDPIDRAFT_34482 [Hydnomerulius pinastri MD-312]|uniref:Uncharacterized protein n=1 Tax=Hydnomerulius pinastri MD-312 TaxID=994086 RepID=A0A0C9W734_9AGAM|nr:hypothetical protein HYDPIDRAFT_34482 [Hydnomerulius pinastri MD-312]
MMVVTQKKKLGAGSSNIPQVTTPITRVFGRADARSGQHNNINPTPNSPFPEPTKTQQTPFFRSSPRSIPIQTSHHPTTHVSPLKLHLQSHHAPPKAPTYPALRVPRRDKSMVNVNGSPLANPYLLGFGWFAWGDEDAGEEGEDHSGIREGRGRERICIAVGRDPSVTLPSSSHQPIGTNSQSAIPHSTSHSRTNSRSQLFVDPSTTIANTSIPSLLSSHLSAPALISLPTSDSHLLEFDPFTTSPLTLESVVGISESLKKQAREEMGRLVREAVRKSVIE